jgi:hypothetical protein
MYTKPILNGGIEVGIEAGQRPLGIPLTKPGSGLPMERII